MLGVFLAVASTFVYNASAVLLTVAARRQSGASTLLLAVSRSPRGLLAISLNLLGWVLEVAALAMIPLTLARLLNVAGLGVLLGLTRWFLKEPLGGREITGLGLIAFGIAAVSFAPPRIGSVRPDLGGWASLVAILGIAVAVPYMLRILLRGPAHPVLGATAAGVAFALCGVLSKGAAYAIQPFSPSILALFTTGVAAIGLLGFGAEVRALRDGYASIVVPIVLALHTTIPIICAPVFFGETWPVDPLSRTLLGGGVLLAVAGIVMLARSSSHVLVEKG